MVERFRGVPGLFMPTNSIVKDSSGYSDNIFEGKADQMLKVCEYLEEKGFNTQGSCQARSFLVLRESWNR
ncbi:unnamed protein product [Rhizophagus irregularis]|nr:unnamed protein product [Rhizophagus irregularis]